MGLSWSRIVNTLHKLGRVAGKAEKVAIAVEPFAVSALNIAGQPAAAAAISSVYQIVNETEQNLASQPGATKLAVAKSAISSGVIPMLALGLNYAGKDFNADKANAALNSSIDAVVAENNAQAHLQDLLSKSSDSVKLDPTALADAVKAVSQATAGVIQAGADIHSAISDMAKVSTSNK